MVCCMFEKGEYEKERDIEREREREIARGDEHHTGREKGDDDQG